ncbi:Uncharacterised protein [Mycobacteroides abscessus subsp. abscessus]|nr:Uncharacterised protein [Mycobacteroides abscessus subsp. abscessus]
MTRLAGSGMSTSSSNSTARSRACLRDIFLCAQTASAICQPMVYTGFSAVIGSWKMTATSLPRTARNSSLVAPSSSAPLSFTLPRTRALGGNKAGMAMAVVDFPDPDSPTIASTSPLATDNETPLTAGTHCLSTSKSTVRPVMSTTESLVGTSTYLLRGSSASRRASPTMMKPSTAAERNNAGTMTSRGVEANRDCPSLICNPHEISGSSSPMPI